VLKTSITEQFGLKYPIMSSPMAMHSGGLLAGATTQAGGLGLFGAINPGGGPQWLAEQIRLARDMCGEKPFGVGFITQMIPVFPDMFELALEENVPVITFSFDDPAQWLERARANGATTICQVQSVEGAAQAVAAGTDLLVVQGNEAGGHTGVANLMPLLLRILKDYPDTPILAAGGIASGHSLAAVLAAGAAGAWIGTALMATPECDQVPDEFKQLLLKARSEDTVFTRVFDILDEAAYGIPPWPVPIGARVITNKTTDELHGKEDLLQANLQQHLPAYQQALAEGDLTRKGIFAGESVDFVNEIRPVAQVLETICSEAEQALK